MATRAAKGTAAAPTGRKLTDTDLCVCIINIYAFRLPFSFVYREVGQQKRVLMSGPSWRSVPKSKSSSAILQELPPPTWSGGTNAGVCFCLISSTCI